MCKQTIKTASAALESVTHWTTNTKHTPTTPPREYMNNGVTVITVVEYDEHGDIQDWNVRKNIYVLTISAAKNHFLDIIT